MAFNRSSWRSRFRSLTAGLTRQTLAQLGISSVYAFICLNAIQPVVEAAKSGEAFALAELRLLAGSVGINLISNIIQRWKDRVHAARDIEDVLRSPRAGQFARSIAPILKELDAFRSTGRLLADEDRSWFASALSRELEQYGVWQYHGDEMEATFLTIFAPTSVTQSDVSGRASIGPRIDVHQQISFTKPQPSAPQPPPPPRVAQEPRPTASTEDEFWVWLIGGLVVIALLASLWQAYSESFVSIASLALGIIALAASTIHLFALLAFPGRRHRDFILLVYLLCLWIIGIASPLLGVYSPLFGYLPDDFTLSFANALQAIGVIACYGGLLILPPVQFFMARIYRKATRLITPSRLESWMLDKRAQALSIASAAVLLGALLASGLISRLVLAAGLFGR